MSTVEEAPTHSEAKYSIYERGKTEELISERTIRIKGILLISRGMTHDYLIN